MFKIFIPSANAVKLQVCNLTSLSVLDSKQSSHDGSVQEQILLGLDAILVCSRGEHMKLVLCNVRPAELLQATGPAVVLSRQYSYKTVR